MADLTTYVPDLGFTNLGFMFSLITFLIVGVIAIALIVVATVVLINYLKYNRKLIIFENINGKWEATRRDKAAEIKFGDLGDRVFYAKKNKKFLPLPQKQSGRRTYWFAIRPENGQWVNIGDLDIDTVTASAKLDFTDREMLYAAQGMRKNMKERFQKITFLEKYGAIIVWVSLIAITGIVVWLWFDKLAELAAAANRPIELANDVLDRTDAILGKLDSICAGGSGIRTA